MTSRTRYGEPITRSVLVAVADCTRNEGVLIGGTCNTFIKNGGEDDIGVEPLSMVAIVPFDAQQPNTTGFVECRARVPDGVDVDDLDWDIEAVAECCLDGEDYDYSDRLGWGGSGGGGSSSGSNNNKAGGTIGNGWGAGGMTPPPPQGGTTNPSAPSLVVINNPPAPTGTGMPGGPTDGLDPGAGNGEEDVPDVFDPGADGEGGAWTGTGTPGSSSWSMPAANLGVPNPNSPASGSAGSTPAAGAAAGGGGGGWGQDVSWQATAGSMPGWQQGVAGSQTPGSAGTAWPSSGPAAAPAAAIQGSSPGSPGRSWGNGGSVWVPPGAATGAAEGEDAAMEDEEYEEGQVAPQSSGALDPTGAGQLASSTAGTAAKLAAGSSSSSSFWGKAGGEWSDSAGDN